MADRRRKITKRGGRKRAADARAQERARRDAGAPGFFKRMFMWMLGLALLGTLMLAIAVLFAMRSLPSYNELKATQPGQTVVIRARDGTEIVTLGPSYGRWLDSNEIPKVMKNAMVAVEDRRFYSHIGVDPLGLMRAVWVAATGDRRIGATSTITQQLARNLFLNSNRSFDRKAREGILALALEAKFSKQQILELYLNKVYFGGGAYGVDSASRKFFSHPANELTTAEAAIIAGLVKAPSRYSPTADVDAAVGRASVVLQLMQEQGMISPDEAEIDVSAVNLEQEKAQNSARYFTDYVLPQLDLLIPDTNEPIEVWTTLDLGMQRAATAAIQANTPKGSQGALVAMDRDGAILAMVGGTDYVETNYNRATRALRQPGSAWKLFVYLAALEAGHTPDDRVVDTPVTIDGWSPRNSNGQYSGEIDIRTAFAYSKNTVAAQLGNEVGFGTVASMAKRFGITTPIKTFPSMVLGSSEVRLLDMTRAFASVGARGRSIEPYGIVRVTTSDGDELYRNRTRNPSPLVPDYVAAGITDLLQTTVNTGTGRAAQIGRPVAGKTGTTNSNKDGWFLGFSSGITTGVWMGRDDARPVGGLQGGRAPAQAFAAFMRYAVKDRPIEEFDTEVKLPEWQLEPDDEYFLGNPDDYYFIDEQGNLVEPGKGRAPGEAPFPVEGEQQPDQPPGILIPAQPQRTVRPAVNEDFLNEATGKQAPRPAKSSGPRVIDIPPRSPAPAN